MTVSTPWTGCYEIDLVEVGRRVANAYDEAFSVNYRIHIAYGFTRREVPIDLPITWEKRR